MKNLSLTQTKHKIFATHIENITCTFDQLYALTHTGKNASDRLKAIDMYLRYMLGTDKLMDEGAGGSPEDFMAKLKLTPEERKVLMEIDQKLKGDSPMEEGQETAEESVVKTDVLTTE